MRFYSMPQLPSPGNGGFCKPILPEETVPPRLTPNAAKLCPSTRKCLVPVAVADVNGLNSFADEAANKNGWGVYCHHGIGSDGHSWAVTNLNAMKEHLNYLDRNRDKIWCETFGNVARYIKERDAASLTVESSEPNQIKVKLTDNLPDNL